MKPGSYTGAILGQRPRYPYVVNQDSSQWDRLHLWFPFEPAMGERQLDLAGFRVGTLDQNTFQSQSLLNDELDFVAPNGDFPVGFFTAPNVGTVSFWISTTDGGATLTRIMGLETLFEIRKIADGTLVNEFHVSGVGPASTTAINDGRLYHCVMTWDIDAPLWKVYVDGVLETSTSAPTLSSPTNQALTIGGVTLACSF